MHAFVQTEVEYIYSSLAWNVLWLMKSYSTIKYGTMIYLWRVNLKNFLAQVWIYKNVSLLQNMMMVIGEWMISNGVVGVVVVVEYSFSVQ